MVCDPLLVETVNNFYTSSIVTPHAYLSSACDMNEVVHEWCNYDA